MDLNKYALLLGSLVANLQSLEFALRTTLFNHNNRSTSGLKFEEIQVDDEVDENELTNYDTLGELIDKYNGQIASGDEASKIDTYMINIRDALAHGRVSSSSPTEHMRIIKFNKPKSKKVIVNFSEEMSELWMKSTIERVHNEVQKVNNKG